MSTSLDCRGLNCPAPVLQTKKMIDERRPQSIQITVDNEAARQNVTRFLTSQNYSVQVEEEKGEFRVSGSSAEEQQAEIEPAREQEQADRQKIMVLVTSDQMGTGDESLGRKLMTSFLTTINEMGPDLWRLVFVNNGVKLTIRGSDVLETLQDYEAKGLHILVCGTCLNHFDLLEAKEVGETTNMLDIVTAMQLANKVINL